MIIRLRNLLSQKGFRLFLLIFPILVLIFLFSYLPLQGWAYAFFDFRPGVKLADSSFAGLKYFASLFKDKYALMDTVRVMKNTLGISGLSLLSAPLPMLIAVLLNEIKSGPFRRIAQTLTTLPNFISWVLVYSFAFSMFSVSSGFVNNVLIKMGVIEEGINFLASNKHVWLTMWGYSTWKNLGWSSIVYVASISSIDQELYEAATVDGAGRFARMWYITIPSLVPTFFVLLMLSIGNIINNGMEQYFMFQNAMNQEHIEVLDLYVYNQGLIGRNYSLATAVGILKTLVSLILLFAANGLSKIVRKESLF